MATSEKLVDRQARLARNQALFREVNERVNDVKELLQRRARIEDCVCECANETCTERLRLTVDEYEALRATPTNFAVTPAESHVFLDVERVVERTDRYWVVQKIEAGASVAESFDPRAEPVAPAP